MFPKILKCLYGVIEIADHVFCYSRAAAECTSDSYQRIFDDLKDGEDALDFLFG
jgi:hypothetical protein